MIKKYVLQVACLVFALTGSAQAATVQIVEDHTSTTAVWFDSISSWNTTGLDMTGMSVTALFSNGDKEQVFWDATGAGNGADGTGWSLYMETPSATTFYDWNSNGSYWNLDVETGGRSISSVLLYGLDDNTVFDNEYVTSRGTVGSAWGNPLTINTTNPTVNNPPTTTYDGIIQARYFGDVGINGNAIYGDVYQGMEISFLGDGTNPPAFDESDVLAFWQDTDNVTDPVPEPATFALFGIGIAGLLVGQYRRKKK